MSDKSRAEEQLGRQTRPSNTAETPPAWTTAPTQEDSAQAVDGISPVYQPHDMFSVRESGTQRIKLMGSSSSACLTLSLNLYLKRLHLNPVSGHFKHGMRHAEEYHLPLRIDLPLIKDVELRDMYIQRYFDRIHRLFPIFDIDAMKRTINQLATMPNLDDLPQDQIPNLVSAYLIISLGMDEDSDGPTEKGEIYLKAAASLVGHIILVPYLSTVQALLLLVVAYRGRNKDGLGWQTMGMAIRIAHTLGLHKHSRDQHSNNHAVTHKPERLFHARIWAVCCCLEKTLQLESGRPTPIATVGKDQMMGAEQRPPGLDYLQWHMGLAAYQSQICDHIYNHKPGGRSSRQILLDTARLDKGLLDWSNQLPPDFQPGGDLFCVDEDFHIAALLSIQYNQAMIALHRAALIAPTAMFDTEITRECPDEPSKARLKSGESICMKSARSIARLTIELADRKIHSCILTSGPALSACIVLAIYLVKHPHARMVASDLELLKATATTVQEQYSRTGQDPRFSEGSLHIYKEVKRYLELVRKAQRGHNPNNTWRDTRRPPEPSQRHGRDSSFLEGHIPCNLPSSNDIAASTSSSSSNPNNNETHPSEQFSQNQVAQDPNASAYWNSQSYHSAELATSPWEQGSLRDSQINALVNDIGPVPFDDYNVEELWNWMLYIDANPSPMDSFASQRSLQGIGEIEQSELLLDTNMDV